MTDLVVSDKFVCVSTLKDTLVVPFDGSNHNILIHEEAKASEDSVKCSECNFKADYNYDGSVPTVPSAFAASGNLFTCCYHKTLSVWNTDDWTVKFKKLIQRAACKIIFSPSENSILVADKSGDVYLHDLNNFHESGTLILGHVSMLIDVLVTKDEKFIITCDRDEKIRVSCFPNAYNIVSFCLGHEEFVTSLNILPKDSYKLLSSSGDGTFRVWDFINGKQLLCYNVSKDVSLLGHEESVIHKVSLLECDVRTIVCALVFKANAVWVYSMTHRDGFSFEFSHFVTTSPEPYCLQSLNHSSTIWVLLLENKQPLDVLNLENNKFTKCTDDQVIHMQEIVHDYMKDIDFSGFQDRLICSMRKKFMYSTENEYYKRKLERLSTEESKRRL